MRRAVLAALLCCAGCAAPPEVGVSSAPIIGGTPSDAAQDAVVLVLHYDAASGFSGSCTGTLLTPDLVLTARHCVSSTDESAACAPDGSAIGGVVHEDHPATTLYVFTGPMRPDFIAGTAHPIRGAEVLTDGAMNLCNHDLALVRLESQVPDARVVPLRLDGAAIVGEPVTVIGWGVTDVEPSPTVRQQRDDVSVALLGPDTQIGSGEFRTTLSVCSGDSGGPAIARSGAVIGVVSRGGGTDAAGCATDDPVFSDLPSHRALILEGYASVGAMPWLEGQPRPGTAGSSGGCTSTPGTRAAWPPCVGALAIAALASEARWRRRRGR